MEIAAFVCPLTEAEVQELGRLTVNFGHVEFLLDRLLVDMTELTGAEKGRFAEDLISPLATRRKVEIIRLRIARIKSDEARGLIKQACDIVDAVTGPRNDLLHGFWSFDTDQEPAGQAVSFTGKRPDRTKQASAISDLADQVAVATRLLASAIFVASGLPVSEFPLPLWSSRERKPPPGWPPLPE